MDYLFDQYSSSYVTCCGIWWAIKTPLLIKHATLKECALLNGLTW